MKKYLFLAVFLFLSLMFIFAQNNSQSGLVEDDRPYLTEDDIRAIESTLSDDVMIRQVYSPQPAEQEEVGPAWYYIVILERRNSAPNADISGINTSDILYKYSHNTNDYLALVYRESGNVRAVPVYPRGSRVIFEFAADSIEPVRLLANSDFIKIFIPQETVLAELNNALSEIE